MTDAIDQYVQGMDKFNDELNTISIKAGTLDKLTDALICTKVPPQRNKVLKSFMLIKQLRSKVAQIEKAFKEVQSKQSNVILGMLTTEKLDNYSHGGKLFYPSQTTRFNVADRVKIEEFITSQGPTGLEMLGNTLNSGYIKAYMEEHKTTNAKGEQIAPTLPPGVGTFTSITLNMRTKK